MPESSKSLKTSEFSGRKTYSTNRQTCRSFFFFCFMVIYLLGSGLCQDTGCIGNCLVCQSPKCLVCADGHGLLPSGSCTPCASPGCLRCLGTAENCTLCPSSFALQNNSNNSVVTCRSMDELYTVLKYILYIFLGGTCLLCSVMVFFNLVLRSKEKNQSGQLSDTSSNSARPSLEVPLAGVGPSSAGTEMTPNTSKPKQKTKEELEEEMERKFFGTTFNEQYKLEK